MTTEVASLKIDFKFDEQGIVRIIDIGDGVGADIKGFEDIPLITKTLNDMYNATKAPIATAFGELPYDLMRPETIHIPIILRKPFVKEAFSFEFKEAPLDTPQIVPYSHFGRLTSYISRAFGMQNKAIHVTPVALMALEMHKILWYMLMEKHMPAKEQKPVTYWTNDSNPNDIDLSAIDIENGVFIKIGDRSLGGARDVYYAKNKAEITSITTQLHAQYEQSNDPYKKHVYIIEPAFITLKKHQNKEYNVTGRAFITLLYNKDTKQMDIKIAGAKWMFPNEPLQNNKTQAQMLSNVNNSVTMQALDNDALQTLSVSLLTHYAEAFKVGFENDDLLAACEDNSTMAIFKSCVRPNSTYLLFLNYLSPEKTFNTQCNTIISSTVTGFINDHYINYFNTLLESCVNSYTFFASTTESPTSLMKKICTFSFMENFINIAKTFDKQFHTFYPFLTPLIKNEKAIQSSLDKLISTYLATYKYDTTNKNRALRQAASENNLTVMKLLIYTHRADVNDLSPSKQTAMDYAMKSKNEELKASCIKLLKQVGAKDNQQHESLAEPLSSKSI